MDTHAKARLSRPEQGTNASVRTFGFLIAAIFAAVAVYPLLSGAALNRGAAAIAAIFTLLAAFRPGSLEPLRRAWLRFGDLVHRLMTPVLLTILFAGVIIPLGVMRRLFGSDPLRLRPASIRDSAAGYWVRRTDESSFEDQY